MPKSFKIRKREIHEDPGAPHVLHGTDEHGMKSIVFARFGASIPSEIVSGSNDVYVCLNVT